MSSNSGQHLWNRAKQIIPGGGQLLSKRAERFLPDLWPAYYRRAKGCEIWDLDGNHYYDFAQMGVGSCILGYADDDVNEAVIRSIRDGSMATLNAYEEVEFAERLLALHPWARMARFARTGGEACAIAVRIARAASGKEGVAFCGYHGWHDWYLAANLANGKNLEGQLLPGLEPSGVPRQLRDTAMPFKYNDIASLERVVTEHPDRIGVIIMEPERGRRPAPGFLEAVRSIADRIGAVLVFDEVTSGFRVNQGGIHLTLGTNPDLAIFGKGMSNGFPLSAIIGRAEVMDAVQGSFISSTFWTERTGFVAGLATLDKMAREDVPKHLIRHGVRLIAGLRALAARHGLNLTITGIEPLIYLAFGYDNALEIQTYWAQEMLKKGYLVGDAIYTSLAYRDEISDRFLSDCDPIFFQISQHLARGDLAQQLQGRVLQTGFRRLT